MVPYKLEGMETKPDALETPAVVRHDRNGRRMSGSEDGGSARMMLIICSKAPESLCVTGAIAEWRGREGLLDLEEG